MTIHEEIRIEKRRMDEKYGSKDWKANLSVRSNKRNRTIAIACLTENIGLIGSSFANNDPVAVETAIKRAHIFLDVIMSHALRGAYGRPAYE